jgi:hypothetical protein
MDLSLFPAINIKRWVEREESLAAMSKAKNKYRPPAAENRTKIRKLFMEDLSKLGFAIPSKWFCLKQSSLELCDEISSSSWGKIRQTNDLKGHRLRDFETKVFSLLRGQAESAVVFFDLVSWKPKK